MSDQMIARSVSISHVTVGKYLRKAEEAGLTYADMERMGELQLL